MPHFFNGLPKGEMAEIPSDIASSAAQAGYQAWDVAKVRDGKRTGAVQAAREQAKAVDEAAATVETNDGDMQTYADAEGGGSQGREEEEKGEQSPDAVSEAGFSRDDEGHLHVDLEA